MPGFMKRPRVASSISLICTFTLVSFMPFLASCGEKTETSPGNGETATRAKTGAVTVSADELKRQRARNVLASIPGQGTERPGNLLTAAQLEEKLANPEEASELFILDTRPREEWDSQGHIEGATWIGMQEVAEPQNLEKLPRDRLIVCISPTGHTAAQVASVLRWLGYDAAVLEFGMAGWTSTPARQIVIDDVRGGMAKQYPTAFEAPFTERLPQEALEPIGELSQEELELLAIPARALLRDDVFEKEYPFDNIVADTLYQRLSDPVLNRQTFVVDIRPVDEWVSVGHIDMGPHTHIDWRVLAEPANLAQLPGDKLIVVVGATGQTAGQVTPILRMLGYNAVTLRSGMTAWTGTPDSQRTLAAVESADYPVVR